MTVAKIFKFFLLIPFWKCKSQNKIQLLIVLFCQKGRQTCYQKKSSLKIICFLLKWRRGIFQGTKNKHKINEMLYSGSRVNLTGLYFKGFILALTSHVQFCLQVVQFLMHQSIDDFFINSYTRFDKVAFHY